MDMKRLSGEVIFLPPDPDPAGDDKDRRHVLLNDCPAVRGVGTLAFASRVHNEAFYGQTFCILDPATASYSAHGFDDRTFIYLNRLVSSVSDDLEDPHGKIIDEMPAIRELLTTALGLGTGTTQGGGAARGTLRGCVVSFSKLLADEAGTHLGVVVTDPVYSRMRRYQHVIPIYPMPAFRPNAMNTTLLDPALARKFGGSTNSAFAATPFIFSGYRDRQIVTPVGVTISEAEMNSIEAILKTHFGIPLVPTNGE